MRNYLKKAREELGLTQSDVAKKIGISTNYYCDIENGNRQQEMKATLLIELSTVLKIPINSMLAMENAKKAKKKRVHVNKYSARR